MQSVCRNSVAEQRDAAVFHESFIKQLDAGIQLSSNGIPSSESQQPQLPDQLFVRVSLLEYIIRSVPQVIQYLLNHRRVPPHLNGLTHFRFFLFDRNLVQQGCSRCSSQINVAVFQVKENVILTFGDMEQYLSRQTG
ncbi:Hypothetical_protein [Hexamita inflata]|uniref:Hypothetical_protein n=1 Tax=Hexamita inflata TaxID=28002 RepID=A0AA86PHU7_9EUKA|nr:Hypothetical protein HINF_LOCUS25133 [Hexamita inflata]